MDSFILYTGPMFSGKTSKMINEFLEISSIFPKKKAKLYIPKEDTRYTKSNEIITNDHIISQSATRISKLEEIDPDVEIIGIDELHFYKDTVSYFENLEYKDGNKIIICSGLINDYCGRPWNNIVPIIHLCTKIHFLQGTCKICGCKSTNSYSSESHDGPKSSNKYEPLCRKCFKTHHKKN
jgi:thymidine kinase